MGNPRCKICGGVMIKHGKTVGGKQRFRCKPCSSTQTRRNDVRARDFAAFLEFVTGKYTLADHGGKARTLRRHNEPFWSLWPVSPLVDEVHHVVFVDGIYLSRSLVVLIACSKTHVLGWYVARGETTASWQALMARIAQPDVVVCDGGQGIATALRRQWPDTQVQRCVFHAFSAVRRKTTTRPRTQAGVELYGLAKALLAITTPKEAAEWEGQLARWNTAYQGFLAEQTRLPNGRWVPTHQRLIQAKNTLNTLVRHRKLFTYLEPGLVVAGDPIPATTNLIEGGINTQLRGLLRAHRGMPLDHRIKAVLWWCYLHTEFPGSPADILQRTITDDRITELFATAHHRAQAQQEIERWGTAVNWTDFHHSGTWHETY
ncbi:IS1249 family transposase [Trueperella pyogenes]|nr:IS1249 family transposase [Trueperella pyogenes]UVJ54645.1 IS1249 family transposase [Trueperella pyogenes]UVJ54656.1 IS1249 family transposase [Trueperella pyogenes]UVJ54735.1 IS1249 family transposase [Trueperella pyogenes]UVJ56690.1 IS1249 family transposase [Trueperella pyogenes]UVJ56691.1 IS1249 family transposase [Trueperella pyogenes]